MKNYLFAILSFLFLQTNISYSQEVSKDVTITTTGSGESLEKATQVALRSAITQAFGSFISAKTEVLNDELVSDGITDVASGNIKKYEVLSSANLPNGTWAVTIKSLVSTDKLASFIQAKGVSVEIQGNLYAINIKQQLLEAENEPKVIAEMIGVCHEPMQTAFNYSIESTEPKLAYGEKYSIDGAVKVQANANIYIPADYFIKTLSGISLSTGEQESYKKLGKEFFSIPFISRNKSYIFRLRNVESILLIKSYLSNWQGYICGFNTTPSLKNPIGMVDGKAIYEPLNTPGGEDWPTEYFKPSAGEESILAYNLTPGGILDTKKFSHKMSLEELSNFNGFSVNPKGVVSEFKYGGYLVGGNKEYFLVAAVYDIGKYSRSYGKSMDWKKADLACQELSLNGYSDWTLPTSEQLEFTMKTLIPLGFGNFLGSNDLLNTDGYWSISEKQEQTGVFALVCERIGKTECRIRSYEKTNNNYVRPIRWIKKASIN